MPGKNFSWFAVYTKPRWEKKVSKILEEKGIENYRPLNKIVKQWSDRKKIILEPVFKSYVFVKIENDRKWDLKKINGIINFVYWLGKPAIIKEEEILTIKKFLNEFSEVSVEEHSLNINSKVRVNMGVLMNYEGVVVEILGRKAFLKIESMGIVLMAKIDKKNLTVLPKI